MDRLRRVYSRDGRVSRLGFWRFQVVQSAAVAVLWCLTMAATMAGGWLGVIPLALFVPLGLAGAYVGVRRLHDRGRAGWWLLVFCLGPYLLLLVAYQMIETLGGLGALASLPLSLGALILAGWGWIELGLRRGTRGPNRFGPQPGPNGAWLPAPT